MRSFFFGEHGSRMVINWRICSGHRLSSDGHKYSYHAIAVIQDESEDSNDVYVFRSIQEEKVFMDYFFEEVRNTDDSNDPAVKVMKYRNNQTTGYTHEIEQCDCLAVSNWIKNPVV
jgi:hypothetical protein